jgi:hypothetical protein
MNISGVIIVIDISNIAGPSHGSLELRGLQGPVVSRKATTITTGQTKATAVAPTPIVQPRQV